MLHLRCPGYAPEFFQFSAKRGNKNVSGGSSSDAIDLRLSITSGKWSPILGNQTRSVLGGRLLSAFVSLVTPPR